MTIEPKSPFPNWSSAKESQNYTYHSQCSKDLNVKQELLWTGLDVLHLQEDNMPFVVLCALPFSGSFCLGFLHMTHIWNTRTIISETQILHLLKKRNSYFTENVWKILTGKAPVSVIHLSCSNPTKLPK